MFAQVYRRIYHNDEEIGEEKKFNYYIWAEKEKKWFIVGYCCYLRWALHMFWLIIPGKNSFQLYLTLVDSLSFLFSAENLAL